MTSWHVLNRVPYKKKKKTPYEEWVGRKPSLSYLRTLRCLVNFNIHIPKKRKLGPKTVDVLKACVVRTTEPSVVIPVEGPKTVVVISLDVVATLSVVVIVMISVISVSDTDVSILL